MKVVLLDSGPLGFLTNPNQTRKATACRQWAAGMKAAGHRGIIPEIIDYELRRELTRIGSIHGGRTLVEHHPVSGQLALRRATPVAIPAP